MIDDPLNRTRVLRGSQLPWAKLDENDVALIRQAIEERKRLIAQAGELTYAKLAEKFGVHRRTIEKISAGEMWTHVP